MSPMAAATPPVLPAGLVGDRPLELLVLLGAMALVPVALVMLTSFLKMAVVLSVARSALGAPQVPPSSAVTGLALILTLLVMAPVAEDCWAVASAVPVHGEGIEATLSRIRQGVEPLRAFLSRQTRAEDRQTFLELSLELGRSRARPAPGIEDWAVVAPAFAISELRRAFTMGFLIFLPFLVVDLLVANVLLALGLAQLSPTSVALPFKLLLFVAADGWRLLARGLVAGYLG